jgi:hypothetical protein
MAFPYLADTEGSPARLPIDFGFLQSSGQEEAQQQRQQAAAEETNRVSMSPPSSETSSSPSGSTTEMPMDLVEATTLAEERFPIERRCSSRKKTSTLIYVDGYAIKKQNNYSVNGNTYVYDETVGQEHALKRGRKQPSTASGPKAAPKQRAVTMQEVKRLAMKEEIERTIEDKKLGRQSFLKKNVAVLEPFLERKVSATIQSYDSARDEKFDVAAATLFMQPDSIEADMRDYQLDGLNFLSKMYRRNIGCILGDEMGL